MRSLNHVLKALPLDRIWLPGNKI